MSPFRQHTNLICRKDYLFVVFIHLSERTNAPNYSQRQSVLTVTSFPFLLLYVTWINLTTYITQLMLKKDWEDNKSILLTLYVFICVLVYQHRTWGPLLPSEADLASTHHCPPPCSSSLLSSSGETSSYSALESDQVLPLPHYCYCYWCDWDCNFRMRGSPPSLQILPWTLFLLHTLSLRLTCRNLKVK